MKPDSLSVMLPGLRARHIFLLLFLTGALAACQTADPGPSAEGLALERLFQQYHNYCMWAYPMWATYEGDHRYDDRVQDWSPAAFDRRTDSLRRYRNLVLAVDTNGMDAAARLNRDLFVREMDMSLEAAAFHGEYQPFDQQSGPHLSFPQLIESQLLENPGDYEAYFSRLRSFPALMDQCLELIKYGVSYGNVPPKFVAEQVAAQCQTLGNQTMGNSPFSQPLRENEAALGAYYEPLYSELKTILERDVFPAYRHMADFITVEYVPVCRDIPGLHAMPDGAERYAYAVRYHTTTDLTPDEIFAIGLEEVAAIRAQMEALVASIGFEALASAEGDKLAAFITHLRTDSAFYYTDKNQMMADYRTILDQADAALPSLFGRLPKTPYALKEMEAYRAANAPQAYYYSAPDDGSRPGYFYVNTTNLPARPSYTMTALALHEAVPGHHLQIAIAKELDDMPWFRTNISSTAFVEGWGLYAEALGYEMGAAENGLYNDPYQRFGALTFAMWRACRLVVDVGLHHKGWTREEAVQYMLANTPNSEADIRSEVDRYISHPGQALAYKIGERRLLALRAEAESAFGEAFDIRAFHDKVLEQGALPLALLEQRIKDWIAAEAKRPS